LAILLPRRDPGIWIGRTLSFDADVQFVELDNPNSFQRRFLDHSLQFSNSIRTAQGALDLRSHASSVSPAELSDQLRHFKSVWPLVIANQEAAFRFDNSGDLRKYGDGIDELVKNSIGYDEIEVAALEPQPPRVADLKESTFGEIPRRCGLARPVDH